VEQLTHGAATPEAIAVRPVNLVGNPFDLSHWNASLYLSAQRPGRSGAARFLAVAGSAELDGHSVTTHRVCESRSPAQVRPHGVDHLPPRRQYAQNG